MPENLTDVISSFKKSFSRFTNSGSEFPKKKTQDDILQDKINASESARKSAVLKNYKVYRDPFGTIGKTSERARAIYEDEQNLLKAYKLFKAIVEVCEKNGDKETFVSHFDIESPLTQKSSYIYNGNFIYLICWLKFEEGVNDYVPVLEEKSNACRLKFVNSENHQFESSEKDLIRFVKELFY